MTSGKVRYMKMFCLWIITLYNLYRYVFVHTVFLFYFIKSSVLLFYKKCGKLPVKNTEECENNRAYSFYGAIPLSQNLPGGTTESIKKYLLNTVGLRAENSICGL